MSKTNKIFEKLMSGRSDANLSFNDLRILLEKIGFVARPTKGSHVIFQQTGGSFLNLQPDKNGKAKAYQVRQVREELQKRNLRP